MSSYDKEAHEEDQVGESKERWTLTPSKGRFDRTTIHPTPSNHTAKNKTSRYREWRVSWLIRTQTVLLTVLAALLWTRRTYAFSATKIHHHHLVTGYSRDHLVDQKKSTFLLSSRLPVMDVEPGQVLPEDTHEVLEKLIDERGKARWNGDYDQADQLKEKILQVGLPKGLELSLEDVPRSQGGGSKWKLSYAAPEEFSSSTKEPSVLQLAHAALGLAVSCSQTMVPSTQKQQLLEPLVKKAKESLQEWKIVQRQILIQKQMNPLALDSTGGWADVETTLRGRKAADAAFWFALSGITDEEIFELLAEVCTKELQRFGENPTCRAKDITQMMDRFAAAGLRESASSALQEVAKDCLVVKDQATGDALSATEEENLLDLHSDRCLLMLWKFSARQKKQQSFLQSARMHWEKSLPTSDGSADVARPIKLANVDIDDQSFAWDQCFEDPARPLVIDIGCGMGISLLGLASSNDQSLEEKNMWNDMKLSMAECNFLGVDLSGLAIGYAQGMAHRWDISHKLHYAVGSAEALLERVFDSYPGPVSLCLIQFPTPFRLPTESAGGNSQLPKSALEGFMVSPKLLELIRDLLSKHSSSSVGPSTGKLLLQSNCEDVALWMLEAATQVGFEGMTMTKPRTIEEANAFTPDQLPQRTLNWIAMGGERAVGDKWSSVPLIPRKGSTETEVACRLNQTPILRCLLTPSTPSTSVSSP